jgi:hypothetical protein
MMPFTITPTDALLVGLCLEEYLCLREQAADWSFLCTLRERLEPFIPDLKHVVGRACDESDLPHDIEWKSDDGDEFGTSPTSPNALFVRNERGLFRRQLDDSRHNQARLLLFYLDTAVGVSAPFRRLITSQQDININFSELLEAYQAARSSAGEGYSDADGSTDDPSGIEQRLADLAHYNEVADVFELGRHFGGVCGSIRLCECGFPPKAFLARFLKAVTSLFATNVVQKNSIPLSAIKRLLDLFEPVLQNSVAWKLSSRVTLEGWMPETEDEVKQAVEQIQAQDTVPSAAGSGGERHHRFQAAWMAFWVAFGDVLGSLSDADDCVLKVEYALAVPRAFVIPGNASVDRIRDLIQHAEADLNAPADVPSLPERNVAMLVQCLEPLTRRIWAAEFAKTLYRRNGETYSPGLRSVLNYVLRTGNSSTPEHRFAKTSLSLYDSYRCQASHDLDSFQCSLEEARYVLSAIRMLLKLSDDLKRKYNPSGNA